MIARHTFGWIFATGFLASTSICFAAYGTPQSPSSYQNSNQNSPLASQRKAVTDAAQEVSKIHTEMAHIRAKVEASLAGKDDWVAAKKALNTAKAEYEAAVRPVRDALHKKPEYQQAVADQARAQATLDAANGQTAAGNDGDAGSSKSNADVIKEAAELQLKAGLEKNRLEREALADDSNVTAAKAKVDEARKAMDALQTQVNEAVQADPDYVAAQTQLTAAEQRLATAKQAMQQAEKAQRDAEIAKAKAAAQQHQSSGSSSGGRHY